MSSSSSSNDELYSQAVSYHGIQGLYPSFHTAAVLLRMAKDELLQLCASTTTDTQSLEGFYNLLNKVERDLLTRQSRLTTPNQPLIVLVEGLDGSGKSSLVTSFSKELSNASAWSTPTASLAPVRDVFDKMGGSIARAFYMASNYVLAYEIMQHCKNNSNHVYVVDRWYTSTCAYSIAWKNTSGTPEESIDTLEEDLFQWPPDLMKPQLLFLLDVHHETRKQRVETRNATSCNPWDERLNRDEHLAKRIWSCLTRVVGPEKTVVLNANATQEEVLEQALEVVKNRTSLAKRQSAMATTTPNPNNNNDALTFFRANLTDKPVTLVITGTHCAGKATIGKRIAEILGWRFDEELGDILRESHLIAGGHLTGNGSGTNDKEMSWDDLIRREEIKRDAMRQQQCRVVETWHVGNVGWALLRLKHANGSVDDGKDRRLEIIDTAKVAIQEHQKVATVLFVHLHVTLEACLRRRKVVANAERVPMKDERTECQELHSILDGTVVELLQNDLRGLNLPTLMIDNSQDGDAAVDVAARTIVRFIHDAIWRPNA